GADRMSRRFSNPSCATNASSSAILSCCGRSTAPFLWIGGAEPSGCPTIGNIPGFRQYPFRVTLPNRSFRGRHPSRRITRLSRRAARAVAGAPRCSPSSSCVVIRSSPRIIVPWTADKTCCQSVGALLIDALPALSYLRGKSPCTPQFYLPNTPAQTPGALGSSDHHDPPTIDHPQRKKPKAI